MLNKRTKEVFKFGNIFDMKRLLGKFFMKRYTVLYICWDGWNKSNSICIWTTTALRKIYTIKGDSDGLILYLIAVLYSQAIFSVSYIEI